MSLAVKYRPKTFEDGFMGQDVTATILKRQLEQHQFKNVYLFAGPSGVGKTTIARCFANAINNGIGEPIELDGASNGGVDSIRAISEAAQQRALNGEYKIFIIDECQMLGGSTKNAWAALLKLIEEPPAYSIFILCTTDPQKIPVAILNRVQRFNLTPIKPELIKQRLEYICQSEGYTNYTDACDFISRSVNGCMREAITNLERCAAYSTNITHEVVNKVLPGLSYEAMFKLSWAIFDNDEASIISNIDTIYQEGQDLKNFISSYTGFVLDLFKFSLFKNIAITNIPVYLASDVNPVVQATINRQEINNKLQLLTDSLLNIKASIKNEPDVKTLITLYLLKASRAMK